MDRMMSVHDLSKLVLTDEVLRKFSLKFGELEESLTKAVQSSITTVLIGIVSKYNHLKNGGLASFVHMSKRFVAKKSSSKRNLEKAEVRNGDNGVEFEATPEEITIYIFGEKIQDAELAISEISAIKPSTSKAVIQYTVVATLCELGRISAYNPKRERDIWHWLYKQKFQLIANLKSSFYRRSIYTLESIQSVFEKMQHAFHEQGKNMDFKGKQSVLQQFWLIIIVIIFALISWYRYFA